MKVPSPYRHAPLARNTALDGEFGSIVNSAQHALQRDPRALFLNLLEADG